MNGRAPGTRPGEASSAAGPQTRRRESVTGYVSVLDNTEAGYRVMRCDHSLLGGEWQKAPKGLEHLARGGFKEPIYAVFVLLEAVRLVEPGPKNPNPRALTM